jgi:hypothetical protein
MSWRIWSLVKDYGGLHGLHCIFSAPDVWLQCPSDDSAKFRPKRLSYPDPDCLPAFLVVLVSLNKPQIRLNTFQISALIILAVDYSILPSTIDLLGNGLELLAF